MELVYGKNALEVILKLKTREIYKIYVSNEKKAKELKIKNYELIDNSKLDKMTKKANHQGFVAEVSDFQYKDFNFIRELVETKKDKIRLVTLDKVQDPQNFGQIIRSCECFGIDAIIIPNKSTSLVTNTVVKSSTGACETLPIVQVANLNNTITKLKKYNIWNIAAEASGDVDIEDVDNSLNYNLIMGSEGFGVSTILKKNADMISSIKLKGEINSLNVSVATAIFISHLK